MRFLNRRRLIVVVAAGCSIAGVGRACDVTGWPSTTHHPGPAKAVADMRLSLGWTFDAHAMPGESQVAPVRRVAGSATILLDAGRHSLTALLPPSATDWAALTAAVSVVVPGAAPPVVRAVLDLPAAGAPARCERTLAAMPGLGLARVVVGARTVLLEFPAGVPYPAAAVWRARRYLAVLPTG